MNRSLLVGGPAKIAFAGATVYHQNDIRIPIEAKTFKVEIEGQASPDERLDFWDAALDLTPEGRFDANVIAAFWPYFNTRKGAFLYGDADVPLQLDANDGAVAIIKACALTKMPEIMFSVKKTLVGAASFRGLRANNTANSDAASLFSYAAAGSTFADGGFTGMGLIKTQPYTLSYGAVAGLVDASSEEGFRFTPSVNITDVRVEGQGVMNVRFIDVEAVVTGKLVGPTALQLLTAMKAQDAGASVQGARLADNAQALTIKGADGVTYLTIPKSTLFKGAFAFGSKFLRNDEVGFRAIRPDPVAGVQQALCTLAAS